MAYGKFFPLWIRSMNLFLKPYSKGDPKPKINWDNKKEREELLFLLVSDAKEVLSHLDVDKEDVDSKLKDAVDLLAKIVTQDIEEDKENSPKIKKGVAKGQEIKSKIEEIISFSWNLLVNFLHFFVSKNTRRCEI